MGRFRLLYVKSVCLVTMQLLNMPSSDCPRQRESQRERLSHVRRVFPTSLFDFVQVDAKSDPRYPSHAAMKIECCSRIACIHIQQIICSLSLPSVSLNC